MKLYYGDSVLLKKTFICFFLAFGLGVCFMTPYFTAYYKAVGYTKSQGCDVTGFTGLRSLTLTPSTTFPKYDYKVVLTVSCPGKQFNEAVIYGDKTAQGTDKLSHVLGYWNKR